MDGVYHEFTAIPGVVEDVTAIILNIKKLILKIADDEVYTLRISKRGPGEVRGSDIICPEGVEILSKDHYICTLEEDGVLEMELQARVTLALIRTNSCIRRRTSPWEPSTPMRSTRR